MDEEMQSLFKNHTWTLIEKPPSRRVVGCKWVYKVKKGILEVEPKRYKVKLVAKSFTQKEGIDYTKIFSRVLKHKLMLKYLKLAQFHTQVQ